MPSLSAQACARAVSCSGTPGRRGMKPVTGWDGSSSFNSRASRREAELSSRFRQAAPCPLFRMKSAVPFRRACRSCSSGAGSGEGSSVEFSGEMTAESRSKRRSRLSRIPWADHAEDAPGNIHGPSPPARRAVRTGSPVSRASRQASSSSCSSSPSCHAPEWVRSKRQGTEEEAGEDSGHEMMEKPASSAVRQMPKTGTASVPCAAGEITACRGKERPFRSTWKRRPSASAAASSRGTSAISRAR